MIELHVHTTHPTLDAFIDDFAMRCNSDYIVLDVGRAVPVGERASFSIYLETGSCVLQGSGECVETSENEDDDIDPDFRFRVVFGSFEMEAASRGTFHRILQAAGASQGGTFASSESTDVGDLVVSIPPDRDSEAPMASDDFATSLQALPATESIPPQRVSLPALEGESTSLVSDDWDGGTMVVPVEHSIAASGREVEPARTSVAPARISAAPQAVPISVSPPASQRPSLSSPPRSIPPVTMSAPISIAPDEPEAEPVEDSLPPLMASPSVVDIPLDPPPRRAVSVAPARPRPETGLRRPSREPSWTPIVEVVAASVLSTGLFDYGPEGLPKRTQAPRPAHRVAPLVSAAALAGHSNDEAQTSELDISQL